MVTWVKRYTREDIREKQLVKSIPDLVNSVFIYGKTGSGKTTTGLSFCQKYHDLKNYKIIDLWGGERKENLLWCFPSKDLKYWSKIKKRHNLFGEGPKQYSVHILYPYYHKMTPKRLPSSPPFVKSSIFTIPIKEITELEAKLVIGLLSERDSYLFKTSIDKLKKSDGPARLLEVANSMATKNQAVFRSVIKPLCENMLLSSSFSSTAINLEQELSDKETITVFCLDFIPKEYQLFVLGFIIRCLHRIVVEKSRSTKNILLLREAAEFFKATEDSIAPPEKKIFRDFLANIIRYGRAGTHIIADAQSPSETKNLIDGSQDYTIICQLPSQADREAVTEQMRRDGLITATQIRRIASFEPGRFMFCKSGEKAKEMYFFKPRTMFWEAGIGDFHKTLWPKINGGTKDFSELIDELYNSYSEELKKLRLEEERDEIEEDSETEELVAVSNKETFKNKRNNIINEVKIKSKDISFEEEDYLRKEAEIEI